MSSATERALEAVRAERARQRVAWGKQELSHAEWLAVLAEEFGEVARHAKHLQFKQNGLQFAHLERFTLTDLLIELDQLAAVAVQYREFAFEQLEQLQEEANA